MTDRVEHELHYLFATAGPEATRRAFEAVSAEYADASVNRAATITLAEAERVVREIAEQKAFSGSKAQSVDRWEVADHRFEEARVLLEEVIPALRKAAT